MILNSLYVILLLLSGKIMIATVNQNKSLKNQDLSQNYKFGLIGLNGLY